MIETSFYGGLTATFFIFLYLFLLQELLRGRLDSFNSFFWQLPEIQVASGTLKPLPPSFSLSLITQPPFLTSFYLLFFSSSIFISYFCLRSSHPPPLPLFFSFFLSSRYPRYAVASGCVCVSGLWLQKVIRWIE